MKRIIICLNPFISHFIPTIELARSLQERKHKVIYLGFDELKEVVQKEGFEFVSIASCTNEELMQLQREKSNNDLENLYKKMHIEIKTIFEELIPDIILIGISRILMYLLPALNKKSKIVFYSLCAGAPEFQWNSPPITSDYVLRRKWYDGMICQALWLARLWRKGLSPKVVYASFFYPWSRLIRFCKRNNIGWKFGIDGFFPNFPIIILGPELFEYTKNKKVFFAGLGLNDTYNKKINVDNSNEERKPLIYCSFGTMSRRYQNMNIFLQAIINVFISNPQWQLLLSLGEKEAKFSYENLPNNIIVKDYVSQKEILTGADVMVTHAGFGSVKECIFFGVPMLAFPCSYDQKGNAARIEYHQIGIKNSILKRTLKQRIMRSAKRRISLKDLEENIKENIEQLLNDDKYKKNILKMRQEILKCDELSQVIQMIENEE